MNDDPQALLRHLFDTAVAAADPARTLARHLPPVPAGRTVVVGAGKAAAAMAHALEAAWDGPLEGLVVTRYGHAMDCQRIEVIEAAHPVPDEIGQAAAERILSAASGLGAEDLVLCLISGGGSALLALPAPGLALADKQAVNRALLASGATIAEMNCVRKHLSAIKGGQLAAAAAPARVATLLISDVPGDDFSVIASGPTVPDPTTRQDALAVLDRYEILGPASVRAHLARPASETPKPGEAVFANTSASLIACPQAALEAAADAAGALGIEAHILSDAIEGEAADVALVHAAIARQMARHGQPFRPPAILLSGGETTVTVKGGGRGGRNLEFLLALGLALDGTADGAADGDAGGAARIHAIACDTDGIDGTETNAGATLAPDSLARARALGLDPRARLADNDSHAVFAALGDLVVTGPTRTNVNDFRAILVRPEPPA